MPKVKNTALNPLDVELDGKENENLHLGPHEESRNLTDEEMQSEQIISNLATDKLVIIEDALALDPAELITETADAAASTEAQANATTQASKKSGATDKQKDGDK